MWRVSQFTVVRSLAEHGLPDQLLVFNTETGRCINVSIDSWRDIVAHMEKPASSPHAIRDAMVELGAKRFLIRSDEDEADAFRSRFDATRYKPASIYPILAVTTRCNIACAYCYEEGVHGKNMTDEVVSGCLRWLERRVVQDGIRAIYPLLFGGEPLTQPKTLLSLMDGINTIGDRWKVQVGYYTSTNGLLLTDELASELADRGLEQVQISIDGPPAIHDQRRHGHQGQGTFEQSLAAIHRAVRAIPHVTVKINFDRHNRAYVPQVYDLLTAEGLAEKVDVKLEAIAFQFSGGPQYGPSAPIPPESAELANAYTELSVEARRRGIAVSPDTGHTTPCMFTSEHGVLIGPEGELYKCISLVGRPEFAVGSVFDDDYDREAYDDQMNVYKRTAECFEERCPYIPVCGGGCAYEAIVRTGSYEKRFCTKEYLAELHFKRHLLRHQPALERIGMRPMTPEQLRPPDPPEPARTGPQVFIPLASVRAPGPAVPRSR